MYALRSHFIFIFPPSALGRGGNIGRLYAVPGRVRLAAAPETEQKTRTKEKSPPKERLCSMLKKYGLKLCDAVRVGTDLAGLPLGDQGLVHAHQVSQLRLG